MAADEIRETGEPRTAEEVLTFEELARLDQPALETIAARLSELTASMRRRPKAIPRRYVITVAKGPIEIKAQQGYPLLSILIENPNPLTPTLPIVVTDDNPAAGQNSIITVPAGEVWELQSLRYTFITSATVANRRFRLEIRDAAGAIFYAYTTSQDQAASLAVGYTFGPIGFEKGISQTELNAGLPPLVLGPSFEIRTVIANLQAGDELEAPIMLVEKQTIARPTLEVGFSAGAGTADASETQVPERSGKLIPVRFEAVSIGVSDPSAIPAEGAPVFVVLYDELLPAAAYAFAP